MTSWWVMRFDRSWSNLVYKHRWRICWRDPNFGTATIGRAHWWRGRNNWSNFFHQNGRCLCRRTLHLETTAIGRAQCWRIRRRRSGHRSCRWWRCSRLVGGHFCRRCRWLHWRKVQAKKCSIKFPDEHNFRYAIKKVYLHTSQLSQVQETQWDNRCFDRCFSSWFHDNLLTALVVEMNTCGRRMCEAGICSRQITAKYLHTSKTNTRLLVSEILQTRHCQSTYSLGGRDEGTMWRAVASWEDWCSSASISVVTNAYRLITDAWLTSEQSTNTWHAYD
jgi:hypothetical protein